MGFRDKWLRPHGVFTYLHCINIGPKIAFPFKVKATGIISGGLGPCRVFFMPSARLCRVFLCPQPVWMEGSPGVVCTSGVVCRDGGHLSALCRLVSLLHVDRGGVLQALCRHAGFESIPALQRHGSTKIPATLLGGFGSDLAGRGKVRKKPCKHFWRV